MEGGWELIGGRPGGTASAVAAAGENSPTAFVATPVGVYASDDSGRTWSPVGVGKTGALVEAVAPSPAFETDHTVFAGGQDGLYRSEDRGGRWRRVLTVGVVTAVAVSPGYKQDATLLVGTEADGVLRSVDGGQSWQSASAGLLDLRVLGLALSGGVTSDRTGFAATPSGLYRSRNGGKVWRQVWPERGEAAVQCLAISPGADGVALAGTERDGLLRSVDGGANWERVPGLDGQGVTALACSPRGAVAAAMGEDVAVSLDNGESWRPGGRMSGPVLGLGFVPGEQGEALLAGLLGRGVARSEDYGADWDLNPIGLYGKLPGGLVLSPAFAVDRTLYSYGPDDGMIGSRDGGISWTDVGPGGPVAGATLSDGYAVDGTIYCAARSGLYVSRDGAGSWDRVVVAAATAVTAANGMVLAALEGGELVASGDEGRTWTSAGSVPSAGEVASLHRSRGREVFAVVSEPAQGPCRHAVWRSADGGDRWDRRLEERSEGPLALAASSAGDGMVFVGLGGRVLTPIPKFHEVRGGRRLPAWRRVELGDVRVTALAVSPAFGDDRTLFAATSGGVYVSRDGGTSFARWSEVGDLAAMVSLAPTPGYPADREVYAVALGGSLWQRRESLGEASRRR